MIEIKNVIFTKSEVNFIKCILCFINYILPLRLKFASESYVAFYDNEEESLITLEKDSNSYTRFKITKLFLEENSANIARELANYVITKYRAQGANSFYIAADEKQFDLLNIFKNELNFRECGWEYLYKITNISPNYVKFLKPVKQEAIKDICKFYNENINSFNRPMFHRSEYQFTNGCKKFYFDKDGEILGYFEVTTKNNLDYYINFVIDFAYNVYFMDAIKYIYSKLKNKNKKCNVFIKVKDYFMNSKDINLILKENNIELVSKSKILAKDYYKLIKDKSIFKSAKIIFNDPTTA